MAIFIVKEGSKNKEVEVKHPVDIAEWDKAGFKRKDVKTPKKTEGI